MFAIICESILFASVCICNIQTYIYIEPGETPEMCESVLRKFIVEKLDLARETVEAMKFKRVQCTSIGTKI